MAMKIIQLLVALVALGSSAAVSAQEIRDPTPEERAKVETAVRKKLLDPESAQFEDMRVQVSKGGLVSICGRVNARNTFGGYAGRQLFHSFISKPNEVRPTEVVDAVFDEGPAQMATIMCKQAGLLD